MSSESIMASFNSPVKAFFVSVAKFIFQISRLMVSLSIFSSIPELPWSTRGWKTDFRPKSVIYGSLVGLMSAGGQLILFHALGIGPAYIIFPVISLSPVITTNGSSSLKLH
jgi:uncharacterized membrane protein